ncbi:hypothetical protein OROGR_018126 [Orobanche gracilis]
MSVLLKKWTVDFVFDRDMFRLVSIWVKLPQLPLALWGASTLGKIASAISKALYMDECTTKLEFHMLESLWKWIYET